MTLPSFAIGPVAVEPGLVLAPMSGITDVALRRAIKLHNDGAVGQVVTGFVSVEGLSRRNRRSRQMLARSDEERPVAAQLFGVDIDRMLQAAEQVVEFGFDVLDVNAGCPAPKVTKRGGGARLMQRCDHLDRLLRALVAAVDIPVTLKIRSGWDKKSINAVEVAQLAEAAGVRMIAVHGRTRVQAYSGTADWGLVEEVADAVRIPVVGSGDVRTVDDARERLSSGKLAGLMIGRGAIRNPWIFQGIRDGLNGRSVAPPSFAQRTAFLREYALSASEHLPPKAVLGRVKGLATQLTKGLVGGAALRVAVYRTQGVEEALDLLSGYEEPRARGHAEEQAA